MMLLLLPFSPWPRRWQSPAAPWASSSSSWSWSPCCGTSTGTAGSGSRTGRPRSPARTSGSPQAAGSRTRGSETGKKEENYYFPAVPSFGGERKTIIKRFVLDAKGPQLSFLYCRLAFDEKEIEVTRLLIFRRTDGDSLPNPVLKIAKTLPIFYFEIY